MKSTYALPTGRPKASTNVLAAAAISILSLVGVATPAAAAGPADLANRRMEQLLRELATQGQKANLATLVTRAASVKVVGTIKRTSQFTLPLTCALYISDQYDHDETKSAPVVFNGNVGTCTVDIPFKWANTDADGQMYVYVYVSNGTLDGQTSPAAPVPISRGSSFSYPPVPLPDSGKTAQLTFDIRM